MTCWPGITNADEIPSPALLLDDARMASNLASMLRIAGDPARLRPHLKTHKLPQLVRRQVEAGITKAKVATIAEAEMAAVYGVRDVLLSMQPVGPNARRLARLAALFPHVRFSAIVDAPEVVGQLARTMIEADNGRVLGTFVDLDIGQHRTGVVPGPDAAAVVHEILRHPALQFRGLHAYDGHLGIADPVARGVACDSAFAGVELLRDHLVAAGIPVPVIIAGGSPTFALHARRSGVELSPGTTVLWDAGYGTKLADLPFEPAAFLLTRVVSRPAPDCLCLDLGHKAVGSEMTPPRAIFPALPEAEAISHSEEHLVLRTPRANEFAIGDVLYAIPWHVCPTVALHQEAWLVRDGRAVERWTIEARARRITI
jgi:D-serine deaminase-like pyridoxal phosphate-dependent protein